MKLKSLTIALALAATSASSFAAEKQGFYIGAFGDYYDNSWENVRDYTPGGLDVDDSTGWGLELGYRFSDYWSARLEYADMDFDWKADLNDGTSVSGTESGKRYGIEALYHLGGGPFYGIFGLKNLDAVDEDLMFANVGAGYQHYFTDNFAFNAETSLYQGLDRGYTDVGAKLGLSYIFGAQSSASDPFEPAPTVVPVAVEPVDSDGDNDLITAEYSTGLVSWWNNDGSGNFTKNLEHDSASSVWDVYAGDIDDDGDIGDAAAADSDSNRLVRSHFVAQRELRKLRFHLVGQIFDARRRERLANAKNVRVI